MRLISLATTARIYARGADKAGLRPQRKNAAIRFAAF
jgi:hypothetical protein